MQPVYFNVFCYGYLLQCRIIYFHNEKQVFRPPKLHTHHRAQQGEGMTDVHKGTPVSKDTSAVIRGFLGQDIMERIHCLGANWLTSHMSLHSSDLELGPKRSIESPTDHNQQLKTLILQDSILSPIRLQSTANALETSEWDLTPSLSNTGDPMVQPSWSLSQDGACLIGRQCVRPQHPMPGRLLQYGWSYQAEKAPWYSPAKHQVKSGDHRRVEPLISTFLETIAPKGNRFIYIVASCQIALCERKSSGILLFWWLEQLKFTKINSSKSS